MARSRCDTAPEKPIPESVYVSDVRAYAPPPTADANMEEGERDEIYKKWLEQKPYLEFEIISRSLFQDEAKEKLTIRAMLVAKEGNAEYIARLAQRNVVDDILLSHQPVALTFFEGRTFSILMKALGRAAGMPWTAFVPTQTAG